MSPVQTTPDVVQHKSFQRPEDVREFPKGRVEIVNVGDFTLGRATLQPGWRWSTCVKPVVKTKSCQAAHLQYHVSGRLHVVMDDGTEQEFVAGDVSYLPPGHDAWVVGNESVVMVDITGMGNYAKPR